MPQGVHLVGYAPEAKSHFLSVGVAKSHFQVVQLRSAHIVRPPDAGLGHLFFLEHHAGFSRLQAHFLREVPALILALEHALHGLVATVHQGGSYRDGSLGKVFRKHRAHIHILHLHIGHADDAHRGNKAHELIQRMGVPVHKPVIQAAPGGLVGANLQRILFLYQRRDVPLPGGENAQGGIGAGHKSTVHQDIGRITQSPYTQDPVSLAALEMRGENPGAVKKCLVDIEKTESFQRILPEYTGPVKGAGHGGGSGNLVDFGGTFLLHAPLRKLQGVLEDSAGGHQKGGQEKGCGFHGY